MAYVIQAVVGEKNLLAQQPIPKGHLVLLPQGKALMPLTDDLRRLHEIPDLPFTDEGAEPTAAEIETIAKLCGPFSFNGKIAYIEAEIFGGTGLQASLLFENGKISGKLIVGKDAINRALQFLGVVKGESDEFDTLGLGDHNSTENWIHK